VRSRSDGDESGQLLRADDERVHVHDRRRSRAASLVQQHERARHVPRPRDLQSERGRLDRLHRVGRRCRGVRRLRQRLQRPDRRRRRERAGVLDFGGRRGHVSRRHAVHRRRRLAVSGQDARDRDVQLHRRRLRRDGRRGLSEREHGVLGRHRRLPAVRARATPRAPARRAPPSRARRSPSCATRSTTTATVRPTRRSRPRARRAPSASVRACARATRCAPPAE
jgi:hypothetical protein